MVPSLFLLMPDHVHMLVGFAREHTMDSVIRVWKRCTAREAGIEWQHRFFEHRLRSGQNVRDKAEYILQNPVRANLVRDPSEWRHLLERFQFCCRHGTPLPCSGLTRQRSAVTTAQGGHPFD